MAVSFVGAGAPQAGIGALTVPLPSGLSAGDLMILAVKLSPLDTRSTPSGWTLYDQYQTGSTGTFTKLMIFWRRYVAGDGSVALNDVGERQRAYVVAYRGALASGTPFSSYGEESSASGGTRNFGALTSTSAGDMLCWFYAAPGGFSNGISNWSDAHPYTVVERVSWPGDSDSTFGTQGHASCVAGSVATFSSPSATVVTSNTAVGALIRFVILAEPDPQNVTITGTMGRVVTGAASVALGQQATFTGTLGAFTGSGSVELTSQSTVAAVVAGFTASAEIEVGNDLDIAGALQAFSGSAEIALRNQVEVLGDLQAFTGSAEVELTPATNELEVTGTLSTFSGTVEVATRNEATIAADLAAFTTEAEVENSTAIEVAGAIAGFEASAEVEVGQAASIDAVLPGFTSEIEVATVNQLEATAELGAFTAAIEVETSEIELPALTIVGIIAGFTAALEVDAGESPTKFPTDDDYVLQVVAVDRTLKVTGVDRVLSVTGVDRIMVLPARSNVLIVPHSDRTIDRG